MSFTVCFIVYLHLWAIDFNFVRDIQVCLLIDRQTKIGQRSLYNNMIIWTFALQSCHLGEPKNRDPYIFWGKFSYFCSNSSCFIDFNIIITENHWLSVRNYNDRRCFKKFPMKIQSTLTVGLMQALPLLLTLGVSSPTLEYLVLGCIGLTTVIGLVMILMTPMEKDEGMQVCELLFECFILYT